MENSICGKDHTASGMDFYHCYSTYNEKLQMKQLKMLKYTGPTPLINVIKDFIVLTQLVQS